MTPAAGSVRTEFRPENAGRGADLDTITDGLRAAYRLINRNGDEFDAYVLMD